MIFNVNSGAGKIPINVVPNTASSFTYDGSEKTPVWQNYDPEQLSISGAVSATNAGEHTVYFIPKADYEWWDGTSTPKEVKWSIAKAVGTLSLSATSGTVNGKNKTITFTVTTNGDGAISVSSSNTSIATAYVSGTTVTVTSKGYGTATITVSVAAGTNYSAPSNKTYSITVDYVYLFKSGSGAQVGLTVGNESNWGITQNNNHISFADSRQSWVRTTSAIDLSSYSKLCCRVTASYLGSSGQIYQAGLRVANKAWTTANSIGGDNYGSAYAALGYFNYSNSATNYSVNISAITGKYYVGISGGYAGTVYDLWLE